MYISEVEDVEFNNFISTMASRAHIPLLHTSQSVDRTGTFISKLENMRIPINFVSALAANQHSTSIVILHDDHLGQ